MVRCPTRSLRPLRRDGDHRLPLGHAAGLAALGPPGWTRVAGRSPRALDRRRHGGGLGTLGAARRGSTRAVPRRLVHPRADDAFRRGTYLVRAPTPDELVPLPRAGLASIPALPEPPLHDGRVDRYGGRTGHGLPLVPLPLVGAVARVGVLGRPALRPQPLDRGVGGRRVTVPRLGAGHRLRDQGLRVGGVRGMDPALGVVDPAPCLGFHLPRPVVAPASKSHSGGLLHHGDDRPPLRDGLHGRRPPRRLAVPRPLGPPTTARAHRRRRRRGVPGVGLGRRAGPGPVAMGRKEPGPGGDRARERLRRAPDPGLALHGPPLRRRSLPHRHHPRRRRDRSLRCPMAAEHRRTRPPHHLVRHAPHDLRAHDLWRALCDHPRHQRRVHPPLPDGRAALGDSPGRRGDSVRRPMAARRTRPPAARQPKGAPVGTGRTRPDQRCLCRRPRSCARTGLELAGLLRRTQRDQRRTTDHGRRAARTPDRRTRPLRARPPTGPGVRRPADELGLVLHRRRSARVQVPRERGHRRGRLHAADRVADDRSRVPLRRGEPGRLPALRHRLRHRP